MAVTKEQLAALRLGLGWASSAGRSEVYDAGDIAFSTNGHLALIVPTDGEPIHCADAKGLPSDAAETAAKTARKGEAIAWNGEHATLASGCVIPAPGKNDAPNIRQIRERVEGKPESVRTFDARYLRAICDAAIKSGADYIQIETFGPLDVQSFKGRARGEERSTLHALLMPVRVD